MKTVGNIAKTLIVQESVSRDACCTDRPRTLSASRVVGSNAVQVLLVINAQTRSLVENKSSFAHNAALASETKLAVRYRCAGN